MESSDSPSMYLLISTIFSPGRVEPTTPSAAKSQLSLLLVKPSVFPAHICFCHMYALCIAFIFSTWERLGMMRREEDEAGKRRGKSKG